LTDWFPVFDAQLAKWRGHTRTNCYCVSIAKIGGTFPRPIQRHIGSAACFLASTFREAEFWGRPLDTPIRVKVANPIIGDESTIEAKLLGGPCEHPAYDSPKLMQWRWNLDAKLKKAALAKGYDSIVILSPSGYAKFTAEGRIPLSIELNLLDGERMAEFTSD
jgi:hypothetical protein